LTTLILGHPACLAHDPGPGHPESPARLAAVLRALDGLDPDKWVLREAPCASPEQLALAHDRAHVARVLGAVPREGHAYLDHETVVCPASGEAALRAAGAVIAAVDAVLADEAANAFCAVRPPGHHAGRARAMGFCVFNSIAIGALHARADHGLARVAVVDFDVHHGNGTESLFRGVPGLFYGSSHEFPAYPGTGARSDSRAGAIIDVPLAPMSGGPAFRAAWSDEILPALEAFAPELILVSTGFDGHRKDPLSTLELEVADFTWAIAEIRRVAEDVCGGRLVSVLEGGYDLGVLADATRAHLAVLAAPG
jgi:acetoin utilization deacetylase AcuC-like enzyme